MLKNYNDHQMCKTCNCCLPETTTTNMRHSYQKHKTKKLYYNPVSFRRKIIENYSKLLLIVIVVFLYVISNVTTVASESVTKLYDYDSESSLNYESSYNCSNCYVAEAREEKKKYTLHLIKQQILSKMGLEQVPNITRTSQDIPPSLRKFMTAFDKFQPSSSSSLPQIRHNKHWHHPLDDNVDDDDHIKSQAMVFLATPCTGYCPKYKEQHPMTFSFEKNILESNIKKVRLYLFQTKNVKVLDDSEIRITIVKLNNRPKPPDYSLFGEPTKEKMNSTHGHWIDIDIHKPLIEHLQDSNPSSNNITLAIYATFANKNMSGKVPIITDIRPGGDKHDNVPLITIHTEDIAKSRTKRMAKLDCKENEKETSCCRFPLVVDFEQFQWNFIIAPKRYDAYYCAGECTFLMNQKFVHTHLLQLSNKSGIGPCCSPKKMGPISMLYFNQHGNIVFGRLPGMVVEKCGCS